jgi:hypothetical protein
MGLGLASSFDDRLRVSVCRHTKGNTWESMALGALHRILTTCRPHQISCTPHNHDPRHTEIKVAPALATMQGDRDAARDSARASRHTMQLRSHSQFEETHYAKGSQSTSQSFNCALNIAFCCLQCIRRCGAGESHGLEDGKVIVRHFGRLSPRPQLIP